MTLGTVTVPAATVAAEDRLEVDALVQAGETATIPAYATPRAAGVLLLLILLSAEPDGDEPVEDANGGVVQNLACAKVF
jgi:hypothetical protein